MVNAADILNARILVVDDKEANVRLLGGMLRVAGYPPFLSGAPCAGISMG